MKEARENRAHERQAKRALNIAEFVAAQEEAKKLYKSKWTVAACEEAWQKLHDLIKEGGGISNSSLYLGRQPLVCKKNQQVAIARMRVKKRRKEEGTPLPTFDPPLVLPHFHNAAESLLQQGVPAQFVRLEQLPPWLFYTVAPSSVVGVLPQEHMQVGHLQGL